MLKKTLFAALSLCMGAITYMFAMQQQPEAPFFMDVSKQFIKIQPVQAGQELYFPENSPGFIKDGYEMLDISKDEPNLFIPFQESMQNKTQHDVPFILAVVSQKDPQSNNIRHAYYEAPGLNTALFGSILYNQVTNKLKYNKCRNSMPEGEFLRDPYTRWFITQIQYFIIEPQNNTAAFLATDSDLCDDSPWQQPLTQLFEAYNKFNNNVLVPDILKTHIPGIFFYLGALYHDLGTLDHNQKNHREYYFKAEQYFKKAADQNYNLNVKENAYYELALLYGIHQPEAEPYLKQVAEQNVNLDIKSAAAFDLGNVYMIKKNVPEAERHYKLAALQNDNLDVRAKALYELGHFYYNTKKNYPAAEIYFKQAALQNNNMGINARALNYLGVLYSFLKNFPEAERYLKQAAEQNDDIYVKATALYNLGKFYYDQRRIQESMHYFTLVAQQNANLNMKLKAPLELGIIYYDQKQYAEAEQQFKLAAQQDVNKDIKAKALYNLGLTLEKQINGLEALRFYTLAAAQNDDLEVKQKALAKLKPAQETPEKKARVDEKQE